MSTYKWSIPTGKEINGQTYIKDTDNKIYDTISDLVDFVNSEGTHTGAGLVYDLVDKTTTQTITGNKVFTNATVTGSFSGNLSGNASTATSLKDAVDITLTGDASGTVSFDGSTDISISVTISDDSHSHSNLIPSGCIVMWSGAIASIPTGWYLCNGSNGTPNLIDRFIVGAGSLYGVGATGGSRDATLVAHSHSGTTGGQSNDHTHGTVISGGSSSVDPFTGSYRNGSVLNGSTTYTSSGASSNHTHSFTTDTQGTSGTNANLPPYYALAYIMKG